MKHLEDKTVTLNNVIATIPGINLVYKCIYKPQQNIKTPKYSLFALKILTKVILQSGRYEPTRYVVIGSHHDTFHKGASRPGVGHSVFMELVRTFSTIYNYHSWKPGRSLMFASWDGEDLGGLGSTSWLYRHSKELTSRAIAYINLDYLLQGSEDVHIFSSPLFK